MSNRHAIMENLLDSVTEVTTVMRRSHEMTLEEVQLRLKKAVAHIEAASGRITLGRRDYKEYRCLMCERLVITKERPTCPCGNTDDGFLILKEDTADIV